MPRKKTVKFTYEGSNKIIKFVYLIGMVLLNVSAAFFSIWIFFSLYTFYNGFVNHNLPEEMFIEFGLLSLIPISVGILGRIVVSVAQFLNWWDRGSINSKIFR